MRIAQADYSNLHSTSEETCPRGMNEKHGAIHLGKMGHAWETSTPAGNEMKDAAAI